MNFEDIAVIGAHVRVPGANNIIEFYDLLRSSAIALTRKGSGCGGYFAKGLLEQYDQFDADYFNLSDDEARLMDPQQRILLEMSAQALDIAGVVPKEKNNIGVFASCSNSFDHWRSVHKNATGLDSFECVLGSDKDFLATRIAHHLDLQGPACTIQSGCSSSLVALHQACRSLQTGDCDIAVVGAAAIKLPMDGFEEADEGMIYSSSGQCLPYTSKADGTIDGCGAAVVILQRFSADLGAKEKIWGVIKSSAMNNDGLRKANFTSPSVDQQVRVIETAIRRSGFPASNVGYIEGHGTGTVIGDAIEIASLREVYDISTSETYLGSIKANIGHLDVASGLVGFIKALLAVKQGEYFPQPQCNYSSLKDGSIKLVSHYCKWQETDRVAAVTSLGVGGTNVHCILANYGDWDELPLSAIKFKTKSYPFNGKCCHNLSYNNTPDNHEVNVIAIWNQVLGHRDNWQSEDHFFESGGDSLRALKFANLMKTQCCIDISPVILFDYPRLGDLTSYLSNQGSHTQIGEERLGEF